MRKFKIKTGDSSVHTIDKTTFEALTKQTKPYYTKNEKNECVQFAICPACDNPIEIIGMYKKLKNTDRPYGKHYSKSIKGLANYNQQAYDYCPYSKKNTTVSPNSRKEKFTDFEKDIYNTMKRQFDRVIYILSKQLDIKISNASAREMLRIYVNGEGWMYPWATIYNIPWVLGHLTWSKSLYGQAVLRKSDLFSAIQAKCKNALFEQCSFSESYDQLLSSPKKFLDINYCLIEHKRKIINDEVVETMNFVVSENTSKYDELIIYEKQLTIDESYFMHIINLSNEKSFRNQKLLDIAEELMPPIY